MDVRLSGSWRPLVFRGAFGIALALVAILTWRLQRSRDAYRELYIRATQPQLGLYVPTFSAVSLAGANVTIGRTTPNGRQLLFVFTTTCPFCREILPAWTRLAMAADSMATRRAAVYGISLDSADVTREYAASHRLIYPVIQFPEPKLEGLYRATAVPLTMLLDDAGRILFYRFGALDEAAEDSITRWLES